MIFSGLACAQADGVHEPWYPADQLPVLVSAMKSLPQRSPEEFLPMLAPIACSLPEQGEDPGNSEDCPDPKELSYDSLAKPRAEKLNARPPLRMMGPHPAINTGFQAMGQAGSTGSVDGPGKQGNGGYRVLANSPFEVSMRVKTGFIDGIMTLKRNPDTGKDTMRYQGRLWKDERWAPNEDTTTDVEIRYDAKRDSGSINWKENGRWKAERYWGGSGGKSMTIEFGGGWDHAFYRN
ncbi:MAG: hypothetical protein HY927_06880 [Elusimicrobia bacterium]|nr:hypothetical protein [Elusimicrobiota bacterium]